MDYTNSMNTFNDIIIIIIITDEHPQSLGEDYRMAKCGCAAETAPTHA